jgi:hypothetical protein
MAGRRRAVVEEDEGEEVDESISNSEANSEAGGSEEGYYEVERILKEEIRGGELYYYIRWQGYGKDDDTWEPATAISHCVDIIAMWNESKGAKQKQQGDVSV